MDLFNQTASGKTNTAVRQTVCSLRQAGRSPAVPFELALNDGQTVTVTRLLRVLPGKRITGEGLIGQTRVLVKLFISANGLRHWHRELQGITALQKAGLPVPEMIASCKLRHGGCALLTSFLDPSETLASVWFSTEGTAPSGVKAALLSPALQLLGRMHAAGLVHNDLHLGNFLRYNGNLYIIDGDAVRAVRAPVHGRRALRNLTELLSLLPDEQTPLLEVYRQSNPSFRVHPRTVQKAALKTREAAIDRFLGKGVRDCTRFAVYRTFRRFTAVARDQQTQLAPLLIDPDRAVNDGLRLKTGGSSTVTRVATSAGPLVIKRYNLKSPGHAFSRLWRPSRAWRSWMNGLRLQIIGLGTPDLFAVVEERLGPLRRRAWLITAFCPGKTLLEHLDPACEPPPAEAAALLSFFKTMHRERISHGDLKAANLLWYENRLIVIDLDAAKKHRFGMTHRRAWRKDRARLLRNWPEGSALHGWLNAGLPR